MIELRVRTVDAKHIRISGIDPLLAHCLQQLPEILEQRDAPTARDRLFPLPTTADRKTNDDWQQNVTPELRHLFASAGEIVLRDLTALSPPAGASRRHLTFPAEHANAWLSALNQARLILGATFSITDEDMNATGFDLNDPRQKAVLQIHLFGYLLQLFVEHEQQDSV
jgi:hypothetical protein